MKNQTEQIIRIVNPVSNGTMAEVSEAGLGQLKLDRMLALPAMSGSRTASGEAIAGDRLRPIQNERLNHVSLIVYSVPACRVVDLLPFGLSLRTTMTDGTERAWLSVLSFQDGGQLTGSSLSGSFECTSYRLHVEYGGKAAHYLLGCSVGSLSAVGVRNLWQMPWHLGAMELQASQDRRTGRYSDYRLNTQSQWDNASWSLSGGGVANASSSGSMVGVPSEIFATPMTSIYKRADGTLGQAGTSSSDLVLTRGRLKSAHSEYLERHGLLTNEEMQRPALVLIQAKCESNHATDFLPKRFRPVVNASISTGVNH